MNIIERNQRNHRMFARIIAKYGIDYDIRRALRNSRLTKLKAER